MKDEDIFEQMFQQEAGFQAVHDDKRPHMVILIPAVIITAISVYALLYGWLAVFITQ